MTGLETVQEALEVLFQAFLISRPRLAVYSRSAIFARPTLRLPQKVSVDVVSQAHQRSASIFLCQLCYPLKSR